MMTNNKPWQAIVNTNPAVKVLAKESSLEVVRKNAAKDSSSYTNMKLVMPKRYNFDDNGGGYQGL